MNLYNILKDQILKFLLSKFDLDFNDIEIQTTKKDFNGDITVVIFPLLKLLRKSPIEIGNEMGLFLVKKSKYVDNYNLIQGFLNLSINNKFYIEFLNGIIEDKNYGILRPNTDDPLFLIEYSSPNTNKPLHLGHIRNILLGYSISEILKANGKNVHKTQIINDVAIACAYAIMIHNDSLEAAVPFVKGYHSTFPLQEEELKHLYNAIAMRLVISVTKSAINKIEEPNNEYLLISEKPAWEVLKKWRTISSDFAHFSFREACGFNPHPNQEKFNNWANNNSFEVSKLFPNANSNEIQHLDLSVSSKWIGHQKDFNDLDL